jgi:pimeloyl-ACP methyl ester carboxylesterase
VNGSEDPFINLDYFEVPKYANLWEGRCHRLPGLKHAPFWEAPEVFDLSKESERTRNRYGSGDF